ncbi:MAG TPA: cation transporter [Tepidisphaeraceae bacterium]|nr:cation transporter [Tepidisphaeraceae bacterium]
MDMFAVLNNSSEPSRHEDLRKAVALIYITLAWMVIEGASSVALGWISGSLILVAFGIDSGIELFSACVLLWRLKAEARGRNVEKVERRASRLAGGALLALAVYVLISSGAALAGHHSADAEQSAWGIVIGIIAAVGMPVLAKYKLRLAAPGRLNSAALRADAMEAVTCGYLSWVMIAGLAVTYVLNWWWLDSVAALALAPFLVKEGLEAIRGECCCCDGD